MALLACRYRKQINTCLCINLVLDKGSGQYLRRLPESPYEIKLDSLFRTTLVDVIWHNRDSALLYLIDQSGISSKAFLI
jgi:hypothetical protein